MIKKLDNIFLTLLILILSISTMLEIENKYNLYIQISGYILITIYIIIRILQKNPIKIIKNKIDIGILLLIASTAIPILFNTYISLSGAVKTALQYFYLFGIYILARELFSKNERYRKIIFKILILLCVIIILIGIEGLTTQKLSQILHITDFSNGDNRLISVFTYPNTLAVYIASVIFLNFNEILHEKNKYLISIYKTITFILILGIILTYSKAIFILFPITLVLYILSIKDKEKTKTIIQNTLLAFVLSIIYIMIFDKLVNSKNNLLIWLSLLTIISLNYTINLILEYFNISKRINLKKFVIFCVLSFILIGIYIIVGLNIYDEFIVFDETEADYKSKIINNIEQNKLYNFEFDIFSKSPKDIEDNFTIKIIERDLQNKTIKENSIKFGTYNGIKQIEIQTDENTSEIKIEFMSEYQYSQKQLIVKSLKINNENIPLKYKYLPTKLVEKIKNIDINYKTLVERKEMIKDGLKLAWKNLLKGSGGESWKYQYQEVQNYSYTSEYIHSYIIKVILEFGLLGILSLIILIISIFKLLIKATKNINIETLSIIFALVILILHSMIDIDLENAYILLYTFVLFAYLSNEIFYVKEKHNIKYNYISNTIFIIGLILALFLNINTKLYNKYYIINENKRAQEKYHTNTTEYKDYSYELGKNYENLIMYERYNYLENYFTIIKYYLQSEKENKIEILEKYYDKILNYENEKRYNIKSIILKMQECYNIVNYLREQNNPSYDQIIEKYNNIVINEYPNTIKQLDNYLKKQHYDDLIYAFKIDDIYENSSKLIDNLHNT